MDSDDSGDERSLTPPPDDDTAPRSPTYSNPTSPVENPQRPYTPDREKTLMAPAANKAKPLVTPILAPAPKKAEIITITPATPIVQQKPIDRFRSAVRKIIQMHRTTSLIAQITGAGAEPGADPSRHQTYVAYGHISQKCTIEVTDFSAVRATHGRMTNEEFVGFMKDKEASRKEDWVKVRWINIGGISYDVISAVALKHKLHPLAIEDVLHSGGIKRSKCDYFTRHLFLRILCHSLADEDDESLILNSVNVGPSTYSPPVVSGLARSESPLGWDESVTATGSSKTGSSKSRVRKRGKKEFDPEDGLDEDHGRTIPLLPLKRQATFKRLEEKKDEAREQRVQEEISIRALKKGDRVNVKLQPMFIFLTRGGTVITIHPEPNLNFTAPISMRLRQSDGLMRKSADPSLVVESVLDLIVDQALEVVDEYQGRILKLEHEIMLKPKMSTVRNLHIVSGDLVMHKRTLDPIKSIIFALRRYDVDRCAALVEDADKAAGSKVVGFMSHKSKIYLADVYDHMEYILTSLDMFSSVSENLINYAFNTVSYQMNDIMRRLTLATIIFLPLTILTGYCGMNFTYMWFLRGSATTPGDETTAPGHSDVWFWIVGLPVMFITVALFSRQDIARAYRYVSRRVEAHDAVKAFMIKKNR